MIGSDSDDDHCSEPMSTGKSHDRRAAPLEPQETIGRRAASTCSAASYVARFGYVCYFSGQLNPAGVRCRVRRLNGEGGRRYAWRLRA